MKKLYTIICASALTLLTINSNAANFAITVGINSTAQQANLFLPTPITVAVGDSITFINMSTSIQHNVTGTSIPVGAPALSSGTLSSQFQTYGYKVTFAGTYNYACTFHTGMTGTFTATGGSGAGITDPTQSLATTAYPTPFSSNITFKYNGVDKISLFNVVGEQIKSVETGGNFGTIEMNFDEMAAGIYFYRTYKDGAIFETRKIVKSKK